MRWHGSKVWGLSFLISGTVDQLYYERGTRTRLSETIDIPMGIPIPGCIPIGMG